ncbi:MAG: pyruvate, phosphate dikinase [Candidatus Hinthialibacter antarcticus]|nr:pyruvate, phosphate dikinase [Candidatus Hinthialibacter antarcticus]
MAKKNVYFFGNGRADGNGKMGNLLGGKGANLAEMSSLKIPVPAGFTIPTDMCNIYYANKGKYTPAFIKEVNENLVKIERAMKKKFGDPKNPLLLSVRSGARKSMPGMMETILNVGLNADTIAGIVAKTGNARFAWDSYRRLIQMYADVVMEKAAGFEPKDGQGIRAQLERELEAIKKKYKVKNDPDLSAEQLQEVVAAYKKKIKQVLKKNFPDDPKEQLWGSINAVFRSWNGKRAFAYRNIEGIPHDWGTAVNVQAMVFGNMGESSATGVAFTRNPATGENIFYGEWLINAQGEDVVAGIRTPAPMGKKMKKETGAKEASLEEAYPKLYKELDSIRLRLEKHYKDMLDVEFTIEEGVLWMLQCRVGKRNGPAAVQMAVDMKDERLINAKTAVLRVTSDQLDELLHPIIDPKVEAKTKVICKGLPAGPGGATGQIVFTADEAVKWRKAGKQVILVRDETNPEDVEGMRAAEAILTARGGMTSHAALVARGWGKCCIVGAGSIEIDYKKGILTVGDVKLKEGAWVSLNGTKGVVYEGALPLIEAGDDNKYLDKFLAICDTIRRLKVRTNAETPEDAKKALGFGAEGIGLFRTEHMFYGKGSEQPLSKLRKMIMSETVEERKKALKELYPFVKKDIKATLLAMNGLPVTFRLLDPPLHEFVPHEKAEVAKLCKELKISPAEFKKRAEALSEVNPMMGHRGVRLGVTYPEVAEMQIQAILEASAELLKAKKKPLPEIMIPVVSATSELDVMKALAEGVYNEVLKKTKLKKIPHMFGTMIEIPRACLVADDIAEVAEFFSFGTNDLTQMTFGYSRDDSAGFLHQYVEDELLEGDPFQSIDESGVGELIKVAVERGQKTRKGIKLGICGEHGGDPKSVFFCHKVGLDYVSCSPFRVPIARHAAACVAALEKK